MRNVRALIFGSTLISIFLGTSAFANQNLNYRVNDFLESISKLRMETYKVEESPAVIRTSFCQKLLDLPSRALEIQQEVLGERHPERRRRNTAEFVYKRTLKSIKFCSDQSDMNEWERLYSFADVIGYLQNIGTLALSLKTEDLLNEGQVNCDYPTEQLRLAIDPVAERIWTVRLDKQGRPDTQLPHKQRINEAYVDSVSYFKCKGCWNMAFRLAKNSSQTLEARVHQFQLNLYDITTSETQRIWSNISCWIRKD